MAKEVSDDLLSEPKTTKTTKKSQLNPSDKVGLLLRYRNGQKDAAADEAFETLGTGLGLVVKVPALGLSRRFPSADKLPRSNVYVPGHEAEGCMFVKWEMAQE